MNTKPFVCVRYASRSSPRRRRVSPEHPRVQRSHRDVRADDGGLDDVRRLHVHVRLVRGQSVEEPPPNARRRRAPDGDGPRRRRRRRRRLGGRRYRGGEHGEDVRLLAPRGGLRRGEAWRRGSQVGVGVDGVLRGGAPDARALHRRLRRRRRGPSVVHRVLHEHRDHARARPLRAGEEVRRGGRERDVRAHVRRERAHLVHHASRVPKARRAARGPTETERRARTVLEAPRDKLLARDGRSAARPSDDVRVQPQGHRPRGRVRADVRRVVNADVAVAQEPHARQHGVRIFKVEFQPDAPPRLDRQEHPLEELVERQVAVHGGGVAHDHVARGQRPRARPGCFPPRGRLGRTRRRASNHEIRLDHVARLVSQRDIQRLRAVHAVRPTDVPGLHAPEVRAEVVRHRARDVRAAGSDERATLSIGNVVWFRSRRQISHERFPATGTKKA
mmetsp:Transcript_15783/g.66523  ORF Transcript_15783/g.66523 Transcript_15783/m.66523 type:complete len:446 (-) Transcript_15783:168-1505(-)